MRPNKKSAPSASEPARRRGGQPRNINARKHGFYSRHFKDRERKLLESLDPADISAEIELIRVTCARFLSSWNQSNGASDYEASLTALRAVNLSSQTIAMLLRAQAITGAPREELAEFLKTMQAAEAAPDPEDPNSFGFVPKGPVPA
jgi:hypothetical protein